jgi:hypothetical protein
MSAAGRMCPEADSIITSSVMLIATAHLPGSAAWRTTLERCPFVEGDRGRLGLQRQIACRHFRAKAIPELFGWARGWVPPNALGSRSAIGAFRSRNPIGGAHFRGRDWTFLPYWVAPDVGVNAINGDLLLRGP